LKDDVNEGEKDSTSGSSCGEFKHFDLKKDCKIKKNPKCFFDVFRAILTSFSMKQRVTGVGF
jgi:hypothetical protein